MLDQLNALDPNSLSGLKRLARENSPEANKAVAQQFEALFLQVVLKSMRDAIPQDGMFDSESTRTYQGMYDQQLATMMAQRGGTGLAAAIERQLNGGVALRLPTYDLKGPPAQTTQRAQTTQPEQPANGDPSGVAVPQSASGGSAASARGFVDEMWPQAQEAARSLGVPTHFLIGQAALETGWGKAQIRMPDGSPSHNLFNIKAGRGWRGEVVEAQTTEYENGVPVVRTERFRAYASYAESFQDYARLIGQNSRYAAVLGQTDAAAFARGLSAGGYATDPAYVDKLVRVINGNSMRSGLLASAS